MIIGKKEQERLERTVCTDLTAVQTETDGICGEF